MLFLKSAVVCLLLWNTAVFPLTEALSCWSCNPSGSSSSSWSTCSGAYCAIGTGSFSAGGVTNYGTMCMCFAFIPSGFGRNRCDEGSLHMIHGTYTGTGCFCDSDFCNLSQTSATRGAARTTPRTPWRRTTTTARRTIPCYDYECTHCSNSRQNWRTCNDKYCLFGTGSYVGGGITERGTIRKCFSYIPSGFQLNRCAYGFFHLNSGTYAGTGCFCNTPLCNWNQTSTTRGGGTSTRSPWLRTTTPGRVIYRCYYCEGPGCENNNVGNWRTCEDRYCAFGVGSYTDVNGRTEHGQLRRCFSQIPAGLILNKCVQGSILGDFGTYSGTGCICDRNNCNLNRATAGEPVAVVSNNRLTVLVVSCIFLINNM